MTKSKKKQNDDDDDLKKQRSVLTRLVCEGAIDSEAHFNDMNVREKIIERLR